MAAVVPPGPVPGHPVPVVLDVDTGVDDACALLLAARHPGLDLRAVTCVEGNTDVDRAVRNTLTVLELAGRGDVPVARGAPCPLVAPPGREGHVHGPDGLAGLGLPAPSGRADHRDAVRLLAEVLSAAAGHRRITLLALAPLTNVALLLTRHPEAAAGLERIVVVGELLFDGTLPEDGALEEAGFNLQHDPEATGVVLAETARLGVPVTVYPRDVAGQVGLEAGQLRRLSAAGDPVARLAAALTAFRAERTSGAPEGRGLLGDAGAVCAVVRPEGLTIRRERGVDLAVGVDARCFAELWLSAVAGPRSPTAAPLPG